MEIAMKKVYLKSFVFGLATIFLPNIAISDEFGYVQRKITSVASYSKNGREDCLISFDVALPTTSCGNKFVGVALLGTFSGRMMCSIALAAFSTDKDVLVAGASGCEGYHNANGIKSLLIQ